MRDLRDMEADREIVTRLSEVEPHQWTIRDESILLAIALASLDEIERLKRLLVKPGCGGWFADCGRETIWFYTEADAWAAVRKAACNG